jgi:5-bromo-4-chloroindolyl phosphate hydrolysis protein
MFAELNTPLKIAKNEYKTLRKNPKAFMKSQNEFLSVIIDGRTPKFNLTVKIVN